jgi:hypothetical protein
MLVRPSSFRDNDIDININPFISRRISSFDPDDPYHGEW